MTCWHFFLNMCGVVTTLALAADCDTVVFYLLYGVYSCFCCGFEVTCIIHSVFCFIYLHSDRNLCLSRAFLRDYFFILI